MTEIWKAIPDFEGLYEVSDQGRVRSLDRVLTSAGATRGYPRSVKGRILVPQRHSGGYAQVTLCGRVYLIHSLVLAAFVGGCPEKQEGAHGNGDKWDNRLSNLRYDTHVGNVADREIHGTHPKGVRNGQAVLTEEDVREIRKQVASGATRAKVALGFPVTDRTVGKIARRERWTHVE